MTDPPVLHPTFKSDNRCQLECSLFGSFIQKVDSNSEVSSFVKPSNYEEDVQNEENTTVILLGPESSVC